MQPAARSARRAIRGSRPYRSWMLRALHEDGAEARRGCRGPRLGQWPPKSWAAAGGCARPAAALAPRRSPLGWRGLAGRLTKETGWDARIRVSGAGVRPGVTHGGRVRRDERDGRGVAPRLWRAVALARRGPARRARPAPARGRVPVPPHRHHLRGLRRSRRPGAADPVRRPAAHPGRRRMGPAARRARAARQGDQPLHPRRLRPPRDPQGRHRAGGSGVPEPGVPAGDERPEGAARHLRAYRRHRHRARRSRDVLRAGGQCPHALRRLLHAGEPRDHAAAVSRAVRAPPRRAGRKLSRRAAGDAQVGGGIDIERRSDRRAADARRLQLGLLRAFVPGRQARRRAGRRPRPLRQGRDGLHAHHAGSQARRRDLPAHRRRLPRSARLPAGFRARRARPDVGLPGRQRHARQRGRHRRSPTTRRSTATCRRS